LAILTSVVRWALFGLPPGATWHSSNLIYFFFCFTFALIISHYLPSPSLPFCHNELFVRLALNPDPLDHSLPSRITRLNNWHLANFMFFQYLLFCILMCKLC
jgi:hypothetical protein